MTLDMVVQGYGLAIPVVVILYVILDKLDDFWTKKLKRSVRRRNRRSRVWP